MQEHVLTQRKLNALTWAYCAGLGVMFVVNGIMGALNA